MVLVRTLDLMVDRFARLESMDNVFFLAFRFCRSTICDSLFRIFKRQNNSTGPKRSSKRYCNDSA
jgi:hypothetical protein